MSVFNGPIKDVCLGIYDGPHATPKESDTGPIFLGIKNVTADGRLDFSEIRHVSEQEFPQWTRRVTPGKDDIVFSYEATLHLYALIPEGFHGCLGRRMALVRPDSSKVVARYLHYYFLSPIWKAVMMSNVITGATVDRIPLARFPDFPVRIPGLDEQQRIADILSGYDDLIENNRRRIALLEQAARLLYREWFVYLRFPGHEHVKVVDGVPLGWDKKQISEVCTSIDYGFTASSAGECIGPKFLRITDIVPSVIDWSSVPYCKIEDEKLQRFRLSKGDIVVARTGATVGYAKILYGDQPAAVFASYLVRFKPENDTLASILGVYMESQEYKEFIRSRIGGAAQPNANAKVLASAELLIPSQDILDDFHDTVASLFEQREKLQALSEKLREARDLLLPRLMNGEIQV